MTNNKNLNRAKRVKNDEFYTKLCDIEKEVERYIKWFNGKVVYCNCDNYEESNFFKYFSLNFKRLGIRKLIATHYNKNGKSCKVEIEGACIKKTPLEGDGDFRSKECINILKEADIVVTNPPFSLFREYIGQLLDCNKQFLIIGSINVVTNKKIFKSIKNGSVWFGYNEVKKFLIPGGGIVPIGNVLWFTNIGVEGKYKNVVPHKKYNEEGTRYDNYDAININKVKDIPTDYEGRMGVPVTFIKKYNPEQFELIEVLKTSVTVNGKTPFKRLVIKKVNK